MKILPLALAAAGLAWTGVLSASIEFPLPAVLKTGDGQVFTHGVITGFDGQMFRVEHDGGISRVNWTVMPTSVQSAFKLDPEMSRDVARGDAEVAATKRRQALFTSLNVRPIKEVESNLPGFTGKRFSLQGTIQVSSYYNYGYGEAQGTHYAFRVIDGTGDATVYMPKGQGEALRARLLSGGTAKMSGVFTCTLLPARTVSHQGSVLAELLAYAE